MVRRILAVVKRLFTARFKLKLLVAFVGLAAFTGVTGVYGLATQTRLTHQLGSTYNSSLLPLQNLQEARARTMTGRVDTLQALQATDDRARTQAGIRVRSADGSVDDMLTTFERSQLTDEERTSLTRLRADLVTYRKQINDTLASRPDDKHASEMISRSNKDFAAVDADFEQLASEAVDAGAANYDHAKKVAAAAKQTMLILLGLAFLVAVAASFALARRLSRPITAMSTALSAVARGDLTPRLEVRGRDELAQMATSLNSALDVIRTTINDIDRTVDVLATSSDELSAVSQQLAGTAEETSAQAGAVSSSVTQVDAHVQSVASSAEQMGASIREIARNANDAAAVAGSAARIADNAIDTVSRLGEASSQVGTVIKVISSIAAQTNLLALNATIEAARAGEAGRGFAVVAHEVKELAQETARATESIAPVVKALQTESGAVSEVFDDFQRIVTSILEAQSTIASAVEEQTATTNVIARSIAEAAVGSGEIARNVGGVATAAQTTSGGASNTQHAARQLAELAGRLQEQLERFSYERDGKLHAAGDAGPTGGAPVTVRAPRHSRRALPVPFRRGPDGRRRLRPGQLTSSPGER